MYLIIWNISQANIAHCQHRFPNISHLRPSLFVYTSVIFSTSCMQKLYDTELQQGDLKNVYWEALKNEFSLTISLLFSVF